ncbi:MAG: hypothetical protein ACE5F8_03195 [Woeseiaceae bacterium]
MNTTTRISITTVLLFLVPAALACDYPAQANIVSGASASKDEMIDSQRSVKAYMAAMEAYLACLETEDVDSPAGQPDLSDEEKATRKAAMTKKYNAAVEQMELVAAQFNEEVRAYKAKSQ